MGDRVAVESGAIVVGPAVLCDDCRVEKDAMIDSTIVGQNEVIAPGHVVKNAVVLQGQIRNAATNSCATNGVSGPRQLREPDDDSVYRMWPRWSYANCLKRAADIIAAAVVLILFAPVFPFISIAVKVSSPGPVFFRDKRQGRYGKGFGCVKFRTMKAGADKIQDKLRFVSEVDGPQFKIAEDPRITTVGRFLRETYLDEIPQFYNVLLGQMSVVGPRPSPESENTLCPWWRDARLSVRPGITGLWQVCRTRRPFKDFQEWIHYDTAYVQDLSLKLDLWICWLTAKRMIRSFVKQF
jgi:lipopolysaccharide/colanic/teichoic acid biosynthesis glycosyltransferase